MVLSHTHTPTLLFWLSHTHTLILFIQSTTLSTSEIHDDDTQTQIIHFEHWPEKQAKTFPSNLDDEKLPWCSGTQP